MFDKSYLKRSGQLWKFYLFALGLPLAGFVSFTVGLNGIGQHNVNLAIFFILFGLSLSLLGFVIAVLSVRCPKCRTRLLWHAVTKQSFETWFSWLMTSETCPVCKASAL
ncbi:MAG TPA: hypothetical protein VN843_36635 [Anaerolineales bacterium]|nr:hypothetical protein [Anaerolineales bacterium]